MNCPECGKPVGPNALQGLCPECMLKVGLGSELQSDGPAESGPERAKAGSFVPPTLEEMAGHFPQLEILELLGRGGMGAVYKARQPQLDRLVALKILPPGVSHHPAFAERFAREAKALAKLNHPHIVTLYEFGQTDGLFYFLMEFVDGVNLRQLLNAGRMAPKEALAIVPQVCDALQFAHERGIVHRDIKPENVLLSREGLVKIADFGVAKITALGLEENAGHSVAPAAEAGLTQAGAVLGTPQYMAPEQVANPLEVDHRADIYSLGVVFYQMLTGELPTGQFAAPSSRVQIDVRLDEVVMRALEQQPERRYRQVSELKTRVETIAADPPAADFNREQINFEASKTTLNTKGKMKTQGLGFLGLLGLLGFTGFAGYPAAYPLFSLLGLFGLFASNRKLQWTFCKITIVIAAVIILWLHAGFGGSDKWQNWARTHPDGKPSDGLSWADVGPFTSVKCETNSAVVQFKGADYDLVSINDLGTEQILAHCQQLYDTDWEKRFVEDLAEVLAGMGRPMASDNTVKLVLRPVGGGTELTVEHAPMTAENREAAADEFWQRTAKADETK